MATTEVEYPASLEIDYPQKRDRVSVFFRAILSIPIVIILTLVTGSGADTYMNEAGREAAFNSGGMSLGLFGAIALMIVFRQKYPKWWFTFALELKRFSSRVGAYVFLLTDKYPSTTDKQTVTLNIPYPDVQQDLNRWLPLVKWFLAIPHYFVLFFLVLGAIGATIIAWFAILFTGVYPKELFDFVVGVGRYSVRVDAYALLLTTDVYPPFSLK